MIMTGLKLNIGLYNLKYLTTPTMSMLVNDHSTLNHGFTFGNTLTTVDVKLNAEDTTVVQQWLSIRPFEIRRLNSNLWKCNDGNMIDVKNVSQ